MARAAGGLTATGAAAPGEHVGTVDHMDGTDRIKLTKKDSEAQGEHHSLPLAWVRAVEAGTVKLSKSRAEAEASWQAG